MSEKDISLIPEEYKEEKIGFGLILSKLGILVIVLVILSLLTYGGLSFYNKSLSNQLEEIQNQVVELDKQRDKDFEKEMESLSRALKNLKTIFKNHFYWSNLFSKLKELTVPLVSFSNFSGQLTEDNIVRIILSGKTAGYTYLAKQMVSFSEEKLISDIKVSGIALGTQGGIEFSLDINFLKEILLK